MYGLSTINTVISGKKKHSGANVQWLEEGVAVKPGWRREVQCKYSMLTLAIVPPEDSCIFMVIVTFF